MNNEQYSKSLNATVEPSAELLEKTLARANAEKGKVIAFRKRMVSLSAAAACLLIAALVFLPRLISPPQEAPGGVTPMRIGLDDVHITELDEAGLYSAGEYARYIPRDIINGLPFQSAFLNARETGSILGATFSDEAAQSTVIISVKPCTEEDAARLLGPEDESRYDVSGGHPQSGDLSPEDSAAMLNPIFKAEDLSRDVLLKRLQSHEGSALKSMVFSLLYEGDILVEYHISGTELSQVYAMVLSADVYR